MGASCQGQVQEQRHPRHVHHPGHPHPHAHDVRQADGGGAAEGCRQSEHGRLAQEEWPSRWRYSHTHPPRGVCVCVSVSGFCPALFELHGNSNVERCKKCKREYLRDFRCKGVRLSHATGQHSLTAFLVRQTACDIVTRDCVREEM